MLFIEVLRVYAGLTIVYACLLAPILLQVFRLDPCDPVTSPPLLAWSITVALMIPLLLLTLAIGEYLATADFLSNPWRRFIRPFMSGQAKAKPLNQPPAYGNSYKKSRYAYYSLMVLHGLLLIILGSIGMGILYTSRCYNASMGTLTGIPTGLTHFEFTIPDLNLPEIDQLQEAWTSLTLIAPLADGTLPDELPSSDSVPDATLPPFRKRAETSLFPEDVPTLPEVPDKVRFPIPKGIAQVLNLFTGFPLFRILYITSMSVPMVLGAALLLWALFGVCYWTKPDKKEAYTLLSNEDSDLPLGAHAHLRTR